MLFWCYYFHFFIESLMHKIKICPGKNYVKYRNSLHGTLKPDLVSWHIGVRSRAPNLAVVSTLGICIKKMSDIKALEERPIYITIKLTDILQKKALKM